MLLIAAFAVTPGARADGDPASDYLITQNVFLGVQLPHRDAIAALNAAVAAAYSHGGRVRVAVVATRTDLGSIPSLFGRPAEYAKFLGIELRSFYIGPLLIVMPGGFGIYDGGRSTTAETTVLAHRPSPGASRDELTRAAAAAVYYLRVAGALNSKDILRPTAAPISSSGTTGHRMSLRYSVADDSGRSSVLLEVVAGSTRLASITVPMRPVSGQRTYVVPWTVPSTVPHGQARLCVTARDPAGNQSRRYCTEIEIAAG